MFAFAIGLSVGQLVFVWLALVFRWGKGGVVQTGTKKDYFIPQRRQKSQWIDQKSPYEISGLNHIVTIYREKPHFRPHFSDNNTSVAQCPPKVRPHLPHFSCQMVNEVKMRLMFDNSCVFIYRRKEAVASSGDAMFFNAVAFSDLPIGKAFGGGENDLDSGESVFAKGMGAKGLL